MMVSGETTCICPVTHQGTPGGFRRLAIVSDAFVHVALLGRLSGPCPAVKPPGHGTTLPLAPSGAARLLPKPTVLPTEDGVPVSPYLVPTFPVFLAMAVLVGVQRHLTLSWFAFP